MVSADPDLGQDVGATWEDANSDERTDYCRRVGGRQTNSGVACTLSTGTGFGATITSPVLDTNRSGRAARRHSQR